MQKSKIQKLLLTTDSKLWLFSQAAKWEAHGSDWLEIYMKEIKLFSQGVSFKELL